MWKHDFRTVRYHWRNVCQLSRKKQRCCQWEITWKCTDQICWWDQNKWPGKCSKAKSLYQWNSWVVFPSDETWRGGPYRPQRRQRSAQRGCQQLLPRKYPQKHLFKSVFPALAKWLPLFRVKNSYFSGGSRIFKKTFLSWIDQSKA